MKKCLFVFATLLCLFTSVATYAAQDEQPLDKIIAVVNDDVITQSEYEKALGMMRAQLSQQQVPMPPDETLRKQALDQLVNRKLQLQIAKQSGIKATDSEVKKTISRIANQNNVSVKTLLSRVNQEGMSTNEYRGELRDQILLQKLQQQEIISRVTVTPEEVTSFLHSKSWQANSTKEYHLVDLLIPLSDAPSSDEITAAKEKANALVAKLKAKQTTFSQVNEAEHNDLGWRKLPEIPSAFAENVTAMQPNGIAGPIQTSNGFHIIRLAASRVAASDEATPNRKQVENLLMQQKFEEAMQNWISKLRSQSFIETDFS